MSARSTVEVPKSIAKLSLTNKAATELLTREAEKILQEHVETLPSWTSLALRFLKKKSTIITLLVALVFLLFRILNGAVLHRAQWRGRSSLGDFVIVLVLFLLNGLAYCREKRLCSLEVPVRAREIFDVVKQLGIKLQPTNSRIPNSNPSITISRVVRDGCLVLYPSVLLVKDDLVAMSYGDVAPASMVRIPQSLDSEYAASSARNESDGNCSLLKPLVLSSQEVLKPEMLSQAESSAEAAQHYGHHFYKLLETPLSVPLKTSLSSKRPKSVFANQLKTLEKQVYPYVVLFVIAACLGVNLIRYIVDVSLDKSSYAASGFEILAVQTALVLIPSLPLTLHIGVLLMTTFANAKLLNLLHDLQSSKTEYEDAGDVDEFDAAPPPTKDIKLDQVKLLKRFLHLLLRRGDIRALTRSCSLVETLGDVSVICAIDKEGTLFKANPSAESLVFIDDKGEPVCLDVDEDDSSSFGIRFEDKNWRQFTPNLKPLGLNFMLNTECRYSSKPKIESHRKTSALNIQTRCQSARQTCQCRVARALGFSERSIANFIERRTIYTFAPSMEILRGPALVSAYHYETPSMTSQIFNDKLNDSFQLFSDGNLVLLLECCYDYWNGSNLAPLTDAVEKKILDIYTTSLMNDCQVVAYGYRPIQTARDLPFLLKSLPSVQSDAMAPVGLKTGVCISSHGVVYVEIDCGLFTNDEEKDKQDAAKPEISPAIDSDTDVKLDKDGLLVIKDSSSIYSTDFGDRFCTASSADFRSNEFATINSVRKEELAHDAIGSDSSEQTPFKAVGEPLGFFAKDCKVSEPLALSAPQEMSKLDPAYNPNSHPLKSGVSTASRSQGSKFSELVDIQAKRFPEAQTDKVAVGLAKDVEDNPAANGAGLPGPSALDIPQKRLLEVFKRKRGRFPGRYTSALDRIDSSNALESGANRDLIDEASGKFYMEVAKGQTFLALAAFAFQVKPNVVDFIEDLSLAAIRFVYFSPAPEKESKAAAERLGLATSWNSCILLSSPDVESFGYMEMHDIKARLPRGLGEVRTHLRNVDDIPLHVNLFAECAKPAISGMNQIFQEYGDVSLVLGSCLQLNNVKCFATSDLAISVDPLPHFKLRLPSLAQLKGQGSQRKPARFRKLWHRLRPPPTAFAEAVETGGTFEKFGPLFPLSVASAILSLSASVHMQYETSLFTVTQLIREARALMSNIRLALAFAGGMHLALQVYLIVAFALLLPPILTGYQMLFTILIIVPCICFPILFTEPDSNVMTTSTVRNIEHCQDKRRLLLAYFFGRFLPAVVAAIIVYILSFGSLLSHARGLSEPSYRYVFGMYSNGTALPWDDFDADTQAVLLYSQNIGLWTLVFYLSTLSITFMHRFTSVWQLNSVQYRYWALQFFVTVGVQTAFFAVSVHRISSVSLAKLPWYVYVILFISPLYLIPTQELCKHFDKKHWNQFQKRCKLEFNTKLGMHSPI